MQIKNLFQTTLILSAISTSAFGYTAKCKTVITKSTGYSKSTDLLLGSSEADYIIDGADTERLFLHIGSNYEVDVKNGEFTNKGTGFINLSLRRQSKQSTNESGTLWLEKSDSSLRFIENKAEIENVKGTEQLYWVMENVEYARSHDSIWSESTGETKEIRTSLLPAGDRLQITCSWLKDYR